MRRAEFAAFAAFSGTNVPDPQDPATFLRSKLRWDERDQGLHKIHCDYNHDLLALRHQHPALRNHSREAFAVAPLGETALALRRTNVVNTMPLLLVVNLRCTLHFYMTDKIITTPPTNGSWRVLFNSEDQRYGGYADACRVDERRTVVIDGPGALLLGRSVTIHS